MQNNLIESMSKLKLLLDKKGIDHKDSVSTFFNSIYENVTFEKDNIKFIVSRHEHHKSSGELLFELIRVDKFTQFSEEYGYFNKIFNLPVVTNCQKRHLVSFNGSFDFDYGRDYLSTLNIIF